MHDRSLENVNLLSLRERSPFKVFQSINGKNVQAAVPSFNDILSNKVNVLIWKELKFL